jgi:tripeptidyl-peptidase-2
LFIFCARDGRGIIVGILDTGVDPAAIGLTTTSDGRPKVIDIIDCSGSGDVAMGPPVSVASDGTLKGLSGRIITVCSNWKNPTKVYRLGIKVRLWYKVFAVLTQYQVLYKRNLKFKIACHPVDCSALQYQLELLNTVL